ncbi:hepatic triacylglycerol lipase [Erythrolamprus reginae]|uniref:hepatic triacylglycerol lipase n=1 Tax=Erythrolamprus reginae TaxID=121349 RepID=UPI00396CC21B
MRSRRALPLLVLFCALLAHAKPDGRRRKGSHPERLLPPRRGSSRFEAKFLLYSNRAEQGCLIEPGQEGALQQCPFNASLPLVMLIHGWSVDRRLEGWIWKLAEELKTQLLDTNVIVTDWLSLAHAHYPIAVQNTRDVGQEIARFLEWLEASVQFDRSKAHLVGYSLGAHVAGFAGSSMRGSGKIGRITGLDPAGPLFEGMSPTDRLSPDDADFVDAIHTFTQQHMGLSVGIKQPVAHFDFYPNGGTFQPGCHIMHVYNHIVQHGITGLAQTVKCAHERSVHLFIDSLRYSQKQLTGYWCKNMQMFDKGRCLDCRAHRCNTLGYHIQKARVPGSRRLFLKTQPQMPFKVYHYQFKIHFIHEFQEPRIDPTFTISLTGNKDDVENLSITLIEGITQNKTYTFLVPLDIDIGELMMIKLKWEGTAIWENIWDTVQTIIPWRKGDRRPGLIVTSMRVKAGETQQRMTFCSQRVDHLHLYPGHEKMFVRCEVSAQKLK